MGDRKERSGFLQKVRAMVAGGAPEPASGPGQESTIDHPLIFSPPPDREFLWLQSLNITDIIDVGAHAGAFADRIRALLPAARLYCFEPMAREFSELSKRLGAVPDVQLFNTALGEEPGEQFIQRCDYSESSSILPMAALHKKAFPFTAHSQPERITVSRLDDSLASFRLGSRPLIKIDAQGYELHVLKGGTRTLDLAYLVIVEVTFRTLYEGQPLFDEVYDFLRPRGFRYAGNFEFGGSGQLRSPLDGEVLQADAIFIRRE
jgi:FkbM family methyltransferase